MNWENDINELEISIIKKWQKEKESQKPHTQNKEEYILFDGPPFANGLPHYGHLLTGYIKDLFCRYQMMRGKQINMKYGWDCHGLPAEMYVEKKLGISGQKEIINFGIKSFNHHCQNSVTQYITQWEEYLIRQGRYGNFQNSYKTMDISYMESVMWGFKELYKKGLIYKKMRVMPYSWACRTTLSDFETKIDNCYREKKSKAITFNLECSYKIPKMTQLINHLTIWTTTPWTIPCNLAVAINTKIQYVIIRKNNLGFIISKNLHKKYVKELGNEIIAEIEGKNLLNCTYKPVFSYFNNYVNAFKIVNSEFVNTENGTGIMHVAPGFGEEDEEICYNNNIKMICPVDEGGKFTTPIKDFIGQHVFEANDKIISYLKKSKSLIKTEQYIHKYPHCWRTDTPLIYKAIPSWYLNITKIKQQMIANNAKINWIPSHVQKGLFGKWLKNAKDWSISRNRFWGCPIPIWRSDDEKYPCTEVYGSIKELEENFDIKITTLHRPFIDTLTKINPKDPTGNSKLRRVPEVLDCWFESGSMPFAQIHYPFNNINIYKHIPADFVTEYIAQTRGWFYTMIVISTALFNKPPFLNAICHGVILDKKGKKFSKRLQNNLNIKEVFRKYGSDAIRIAMLGSPVMQGKAIAMDEDATIIKEATRNIIKPLYNALEFYNLYSSIDKITVSNNIHSNNFLDKYLLFKLSQLINNIKKSLDSYDTIKTVKIIKEFIYTLNNWYIRRSRERFWNHKIDLDKKIAYNVLHYTIKNLCLICAPIIPLTTEIIYSKLIPGTTSIHLEKIPSFNIKIDKNLINNMEKVRNACKIALRIRNEQKIRIRQPLSKVIFIGVTDNDFKSDMQKLVLEEINVKEWINLDVEHITTYAKHIIKINYPILAKRLPSKIKEITQKKNTWRKEKDFVIIAGHIIKKEEYDIHLAIKPQYKKKCSILNNHNSLVFLDTNISPELLIEGLSRDIIRNIQEIRKSLILNVTQKIQINLQSKNISINEAINIHKYTIEKQTLSKIIKQTIVCPIHHKQHKIYNDFLDIRIQIT